MNNSVWSSILNKITTVYRRLVDNIAFIPSLMGLLALCLAVGVLYLDHRGVKTWLDKEFEFLLVEGADNARMVLGTIIGGMISLTVFSFSMVMVVLNRASDSLSPRVLPQLVASKSHQIVLGFYMGTIVYSFVLILNVDPHESIPSLGILLSMIFAVVSLALFIYFIHSISHNIQVDNILEQVLHRTMSQFDALERHLPEPGTGEEPPRFDKAERVPAVQSGFCRVVNLDGLVAYLSRRDLRVYVPVYHGEFLVSGGALAFLSGIDITEEDRERLEKHVRLSDEGEDDYEFHFGLRKISEIAIKALSPGINDPGTALRAIRYLTFLYCRVLHLPKYIEYTDEEGAVRVVKKTPALDELLRKYVSPIRQYAAESTEVLAALIDFFDTLFKLAYRAEIAVLGTHFRALQHTIQDTVQNRIDRQHLENRLADLQEYLEEKH